MPKFVGVKGERIQIVSDVPFTNSNLEICELPDELSKIPNADLILKCKRINSKFIYKEKYKPANQLRVAFVSNYGTKCGIGTYSKFLYDELVDSIGDYRLFIEKSPTFEVENPKIPNDKIVTCWKRGESLLSLIKEIKKYSPDIVVIQHEFGLFPNARHWISLINQLSDYRVIVTMHSTFPNHDDKTVVEACIPEIIVHLDGARKALKQTKKISSTIHMIPHGCFTCDNKTKLWNIYKSEHTIIQTGFLFRYKGFEESIEAVSLLKKKYSDVYLTCLCSESEFNKSEHQIYFNELMQLIEKLELQENVGLVRGYQSEKVWDNYFRTNRVALFPYGMDKNHEVFGASGAARVAMSKNIPVISSFAHHFEDLPTIKANTPKEIAQEIDKLFSDYKLIESQVVKQEKYLNENSWKVSAQRYLEIFEKLN